MKGFLRRLLQRWRWWAASALGLLLAAFLFAWSGIYNVAASRGHWAVVEWTLSFVMRNSVESRALLITAPALDRPDMVLLGANHFETGCAPCHGAPGKPPSPVAQSMLPSPPDLTGTSTRWKDRELFWIVMHGIKYTGMPAWVSQQRDDEVWAMVAFLKALPGLKPDAYDDLVVDMRGAFGTFARSLSDDPQTTIARCSSCHGAAGYGPRSALIPILHGQPAEFLASTLRSYAAGERQSGIMQPAANDLSDKAIERLSVFYAKLDPPVKAAVAVDAAALERGRILAQDGIAAAGIPPCLSCHGDEAAKDFPRLAGQNADYMTGRFEQWKAGHPVTSGTSAIMAPIAQRLTDRQIEDAVSYFASQSEKRR